MLLEELGLLRLAECSTPKLLWVPVVSFGDYITLLNVKYVSCRDLDNNGEFDVI